MHKSIGAIEFRSISKGIEVADAMVKKADVELIYFRTICPGKFLSIISGNEGEVREAIEHGIRLGEHSIVDSFIINAVHDDIILGLKNKYKVKEKGAIGIMETTSVCSGIQSLDRMLKDANVSVYKLQIAFGIGGKFIFIVSGDLSDIESGMKSAQRAIESKKIINISIIPSPDNMILSMLN